MRRKLLPDKRKGWAIVMRDAGNPRFYGSVLHWDNYHPNPSCAIASFLARVSSQKEHELTYNPGYGRAFLLTKEGARMWKLPNSLLIVSADSYRCVRVSSLYEADE